MLNNHTTFIFYRRYTVQGWFSFFNTSLWSGKRLENISHIIKFFAHIFCNTLNSLHVYKVSGIAFVYLASLHLHFSLIFFTIKTNNRFWSDAHSIKFQMYRFQLLRTCWVCLLYKLHATLYECTLVLRYVDVP